MTTYLGKSCSFCLPRVPFVNCRQFMYLVISLLVLRAGYGIWLYQFLIIAYLFTLMAGLFFSISSVSFQTLFIPTPNLLIIISFQEDNIFGTIASLAWSSDTKTYMRFIIAKQWKLFTVCTEQVMSPYIEHAASGLPNPTRLEGGGTICPGSRPAGVTTRCPRIVTECLLTRC